MKIGMITQWYDPETGPASIPAIFARGFVAAGHEVRVLTGFPNYPHGRIYPGYRQRWRMKEVIDGVKVCRVPLVPNHGSSAIGRIMNYTSFALSAAVLAGQPLRDVDVIWVYNSPPTVVLPVAVHSRRGRIPVFLHIQDLWPESMTTSGMLPAGALAALAAQVGGAAERALERMAARIGVISPGMSGRVLAGNPRLTSHMVVHAPNPTARRDLDLSRSLGSVAPPARLIYAGAVGEAQGLHVLLEAARCLALKSVPVEIIVAGDGPSRSLLQDRRDSMGLDNIRFVGRISKAEVDDLSRTAIGHLVVLAEFPHLQVTMPSKIGELLSQKIPIVASVGGDPAQLLAESGGAFVVPPGNSLALAAAIEELINMTPSARRTMGERAHRYFEKNLDSSVVTNTLLRYLQEAASA